MTMKRLVAITFVLSSLSLGMTGCAEKETAKKETTITTPGGKTTITHETEVKKSGKNPPSETP
jgi:hypothetical protein